MSGKRAERTPKQDYKDVTIRCRVTRDLNTRLETYCEENHTTKTNVMVDGIELIIGEKK